MFKKNFVPFHINCTQEDLMGNNGKGVYILLPGSPYRARKISELFDCVTAVYKSKREHNLYIGTVTSTSGKKIDIGTVASGMGTPSVEIIITELIQMGVTTIIRVGTCGLFQSENKIGDFVVATGAVRDEKTSRHYFPDEFPAIPSFELMQSINKTKIRIKKQFPENRIVFGLTHSKSSLYGREFLYGGKTSQTKNNEYKLLLKDYGVISSEMEASAIFVIGHYYKIRTASICVGIADDMKNFSKKKGFAKKSVLNLCKFGIEIIRDLK